MQVKRLVKRGNSVAIVIEKATLQAANLNDSALFQVVSNPSSGITIQSVQPSDEEIFQRSVERVLKKYDQMLTNLSDR